MKLINNRYKLLDVVKKDLHGTTYQASDISNDNKKVLLNLIDVENKKDKEFINNLINNFIKLSTIRHKYIQGCNSFDIIDSIDNKKVNYIQYYYTAEYVKEYPIKYKSFSKQEINEIFIKLCYALNYLHFRGITYRLLNFDNIFFDTKENCGDLKLRDIVALNRYMNNINSIEKYNAQFIAPEIKLGKKGDFSSDIYSLGVILFYIITGFDYKKNDFIEVFKKFENRYISKIIEKMTDPDPNSRYKSILDVIDDIRQYLKIDFEFFDKDYYEKLNLNIPLINRKKEKKEVFEAIEGKLSNNIKNNFIFIHGEAGIGKSRFVKEIAFQLKMKKINVCSIEFSQESGQMFCIYKKILRFIIKNYSVDDNLIRKYGSELVKILPDLASKWNIQPSEVLSEDKEILRLNNRISNFINEFTSKNPLLIIIDNIHYAHKNDLNIFENIIRRNSSIVILCTYTDEKITSIIDFLNNLKKEAATKFITLTRLDFEETSKILKNILGMNHRPLKLTAKIMEEANGNPRYVEEIVKTLFMDKKIIIDKSRLWIADIDDISNLKLPASIDDAMIRYVNLIDPLTKNVLNIISIFKSSVSLETIMKIIDIDEIKISEILKYLVGFKIFNEKFQDWGYSYDYYDKQLKKYIYNNISEADRKLMHKNAAKILEEFYITEGRDYAVELVYHLTQCGEYDKAIKYCIKSAEKMEQLHIYNQVIVFYNRALELMNHHEDTSMLLDILLKIGIIYINIGELDNAFKTYSRVSSLANQYELKREFIDAQNKIAYIYSYKNEKDTAEKILVSCIKLSKEIDYIDGELEGALQQCKLYSLKESHSNLRKMLNDYIKLSLKHSKYKYAGEFFNEKGKLYYLEGEMSKAKYCYEQSIFCFKKSNSSIKTTSPLNNIGIIYLEVHNEIQKAREYYFKALSLFEKYNYITDKGIFLTNIGETYLYEDRYSDAIDYLNKAVDISLEIGDNSILFAAYMHLCHTYIRLYHYDKAYYYLKKLESEFQNYDRKDIYYYDYYVIHIYFYIYIHNYSEAEKWYEIFIETFKDSRASFDLEQKYKELEMHRFQYELQKNKTVNINEVEQFLHDNIGKIHIRLIRNFLINLIYFLISRNEIDSARYFMDLDSKLLEQFNTEVFDIKRACLLALLSNNKIDNYKNLLNNFEKYELYELQWRIYNELGDEYYRNNDYFNALSNYITALDILKTIVYRIPDELRQAYVFDHEMKCILKQKIENLKNMILCKNSNDIKENKQITIRGSISEIFDFSDLSIFFRNKEFMNSIYKESTVESPCKINEINDLIQMFKKDELFNIELILKYCACICLAERGFVFITDDNNQIQEIISTSNYEITEDIKHILNEINNKEHGIIVTNQSQFNNSSFKNNEIKSFICIPIKNSEQMSLKDSSKYRRKYEDKAFTKEIVGYLYLDTKKVFNNFTQETYDNCCLLINLLYIMIENYYLKKISTIDRLTKVYLRKYIEDSFRKELLLASKNQLNLSVVMCDIDRFKQVNDLYGHRKGDEVLVNIGEIIKNNIRKTDLVGRYGGEEFIIILPGTNANDAYAVCEKLRKTIEASKLMGNTMDLTLSFGVSTYPVHGTNEEELIEKADQALYKSKKNGRNRTTIWDKTIGYNKYKYDKLAGIMTGNISNDQRVINIIIDIIELLKSSYSKADRLFKVLGYIIEMTESKYGAVFVMEDNNVKEIFARERGNNGWIKNFQYSKAIINEFIDKKQGDYFINWNEISEIDSFTGIPNWNSYIIEPMVNNGAKKGVLLLSVPIDEKEFDFNTFNLINSISGLIASML